MKKKKCFVFLVTMIMIVTGLAATGTSEIKESTRLDSNEIPECSIEIPECHPKEPIEAIKENGQDMGFGDDPLPDLEVIYLYPEFQSHLNYKVWWRLRNSGDTDIIDADFTDKCYSWENNRWNFISTSTKNHVDYSILEDTNGPYHSFPFEPPGKWLLIEEWTDVYDEIDEIEDVNNNYKDCLWYYI
jgi:hypothetical protein